MSIRLMTHVWEHQGITPTQKLVLLALADWANDEGLCWPSIEKLCDKSSLSRRAVQTAIKTLCEMGLLIQEQSSGRGCRYWVKVGVQEMHGCGKSTPEVQEMHPRGAADAPNTSYKHQDTSNHMSETSVSDADDDAVNVKDVVEAWNNIASKLGKPKVRDITPERRQTIQGRLKQYSTDDFIHVLHNVQTSPFLRGDTGWHGCGFDWVFKKTNFQKILEGNYNG